MKKIIAVILLLFLVVIDVVAGERNSDSNKVVIVTMGDSITKGVREGVLTDQTFASLIEIFHKENSLGFVFLRG